VKPAEAIAAAPMSAMRDDIDNLRAARRSRVIAASVAPTSTTVNDMP
jgi:hypothetical protein